MRYLMALAFFLVASLAWGGAAVTYGPNCTTLTPSADSATVAWTSTGASHYTEVDDAPDAQCSTSGNDGASTYLTAAAACTTCADTFDLSNFASCTGKRILYVGAASVCRRFGGSGPGGPTITLYFRIGGVDYTLGSMSCSADAFTAKTSHTRQYTNPATSAAWTCTDLDNLQIKITRTASSTRDANVSQVYAFVAYETDPGVTPLARTRDAGGR